MGQMSAATDTNNRELALDALAHRLAASIDECDSMRDLAALSRQYRDTMAELDEIRGADVDNPVAAIISRKKEPITN